MTFCQTMPTSCTVISVTAGTYLELEKATPNFPPDEAVLLAQAITPSNRARNN